MYGSILMQAHETLILALRKALMSRQPVRLAGLGTLKTVYHKSREVKSEQGEVRLLPPVVTVKFDAE